MNFNRIPVKPTQMGGVSVTELNAVLNKFFPDSADDEKMGKMRKMLSRMGGGLPGILRR